MKEDKHTFKARLVNNFPKNSQLRIELAYILAKFKHRAQVRKELFEGKPTRYFEHVRRVSLVLLDELQIFYEPMVVAALFHDLLEDTDISEDLISYSFGSDVLYMVKLLSKIPKEGYHERLAACDDWMVLAIKMCDRLDNLRSLMSPETTVKFQNRQIKETKEKYFEIFDKLTEICPLEYKDNIIKVNNEIKNLITKYEIINAGKVK